MSKAPNLTWLFNKRRAQFDLDELHALLDLLPFAALAIDTNQQIIGWVNEKAVQLTGYTRLELSGAALTTLLSDDLATSLPTPNTSIPTHLTTRLGKKLEIILESLPLGEKSAWTILRIQKLKEAERLSQYIHWQESIWPSLNNLCAAPLETEFHQAIRVALNAAQALLDADFVSLYQVSSASPCGTKIAETLDEPILPGEINAYDLAALKLPQQWASRNSPHPDIHRELRNAGFRFITSAPLGPPHAMIGVIFAAARHELAPQALEILAGVSATLSNILDQHAQLSHLEYRLQSTAADLHTSRVIWNRISDSAILLNQDMAITNLNHAAETSLGYALSDVSGMSIEKLLISDTSLEDLFLLIHSGTPPAISQMLRFYRRNGTFFQTTLHIYPIAQAGLPLQTLILFQDLTEQEQFRVRHEQLEQRALLGEVTASFAHEVRNPINNISTGLQVLEMSLPADDPNQENISRLQQDCNRLTELIRSGLSFIKPLEYQLERINLNQSLSNLLDRWQNRLAREKIQLVFQPDTIPPLIEGDPRAVEQIFNNLFNNAVQALRNDQPSEISGTLAIKIRRIGQTGTPDQIEVSVSDTGGGIPENVREHIFEPFFTTKPSGTGLGLAIVKRIITAHRGSVQVSSYPGITVFSVRFPSV